ncbi:hypothetical protein ODJ79_21200 [Actinoplanes sp. KI2]|uniref:hypothetical protein n=1 Tax=Actinoplanes sp. KI2 TaxID=2983315 RepID=UPI0021D56D49|nr:hypothetical protein [Actinoplanes sp. KI2]MCU7726253.1 hypothetical protein [Actinoplanes sp. KI2]
MTAVVLPGTAELMVMAMREPEEGPRPATPAAVAAWLAHKAVRVLPAASRDRYHDEFGSELYELAAAGASRWVQLRYVTRLLDQAWVLRAELREAATRQVRS